MLGTFPLVRGYEGMMPKHAFELLVLAVESFVQISNVNSINAKRSTLMMAVNTHVVVLRRRNAGRSTAFTTEL